MKTKLLLGLLLFSTLCFAERKTVSTVITVNGDTVTLDNAVGGMTISIGEVMTGSPTTVSVTVQGCKTGTTPICATLDTNASVGNAIRNIAVTTIYDYFTATAAWTGGTSVSIGFNYTTTTARTGGGGGGGAVSSVFGRAGDVVASTNDYTFAQIGSKPTTVGGYGITDAVPTARTVNGHALSANVSVTASDVGNGTAQWNANLLNGVSLAGLGTGLLKNTTGTGVPSIATAADIDALFTGSGKCYLFKGTTPGTNDGCDTPGGGGTVTTLSVGNLSPLFTSSVATPTSTPAVTFALTNAAGNTLFGNASASSGAPTYFAPGGDISLAAGLFTVSKVNGNTFPSGAALGDLFYGSAANAISKLAGPTAVNGVPQQLTSTPSAGAATAPVWAPSGVPTNAQVGTTYTVVATDRASYVTFSNAGAIAVTLPQAGSTGFASNFVFVACDIGAGTATFTPTTSTISYTTGTGYTSAASTMTLSTGQCAWIYSDNANYFALQRIGGAGGVTSFSGDTVVLNNSSSTGAVTAALANAASGAVLGNATNAAAAPTYHTLSAINPQTATYQVLAADFSAYKTISVASGTFTITLVASGAQPTAGQFINVLNYGSGVLTLARSGQNINGAAANLTLNAGSASQPTSAQIWSDGTNYFAIIDQGTVGTNTTAAVANPPFDKSATGLSNPTADATYTQPNTSTTGTTLNGTAPASVSTATGTNGSSIFNVTAPTGGADSNATGTGGIGGSPAVTAGNGGAGTGTNTAGGAGGSYTVTTGNGGASLGTGVNANGGDYVVNVGQPGTGGSGTAGKTGVFKTADSGGHAGINGCTQGTDVTTSNANIPANSIFDECPTAVTAYKRVLPGTAATGMRFGVNSSAVITDSYSGAFGAVSQTAKTALVTTFTVCAATANTACGQAGQYRLTYNVWGSGTACSSVTAGSVVLNFTWTDENAVTHTTINAPMWDQKTSAMTAGQTNFNTALGTEGGSGSFIVSTNGTIIQAATTYTACTTGTGTYNVRITTEPLQ